MLTTPEACQILRCSRNTLAKYVRDGEIKATKLGREYRYPVDQFVEKLGLEELVAHIRRSGMAGLLIDRLKNQEESVTKEDLGMPSVEDELEALL